MAWVVEGCRSKGCVVITVCGDNSMYVCVDNLLGSPQRVGHRVWHIT